MFLDTQPMTFDDAPGGGFDEFRVGAPPEVRSLLKQLQDGAVLVNLNASDGTAYTTTLWSLDSSRGTMSFAADAGDPRLQALLDADEIVAVAYLDSVKLQFDLDGIVLVRGGQSSALQTTIPRTLYRFQRRTAYRVRPLVRSMPVARLRDPAHPDAPLALRIVDVSLGGCALALPADVPAPQPGSVLGPVVLELDADTRIETRLRLHHITAINPGVDGARLGCSMLDLPAASERMLQRYIDQTQKRRRTMALD